jgi:hypothetical protein
MRGNPDGSLSSPGRFATGLLSLRYIDGIVLEAEAQPRVGELVTKSRLG